MNKDGSMQGVGVCGTDDDGAGVTIVGDFRINMHSLAMPGDMEMVARKRADGGGCKNHNGREGAMVCYSTTYGLCPINMAGHPGCQGIPAGWAKTMDEDGVEWLEARWEVEGESQDR